jgi:RNA-directed DNA polymerase
VIGSIAAQRRRFSQSSTPRSHRDTAKPPKNGTHPDRRHSTFWDLHYWGQSRQGAWVVKRKTANSRLKRALAALSEWCRKNLHAPIKERHRKLVQKLRGHYGYYGITGNYFSLQEFREGA